MCFTELKEALKCLQNLMLAAPPWPSGLCTLNTVEVLPGLLGPLGQILPAVINSLSSFSPACNNNSGTLFFHH